MSHYESVFILNPALSEEQVNDVIKKYEKLLKDNSHFISLTDRKKIVKKAIEMKFDMIIFY